MILLFLDLLGTFAFAITGAVKAAKSKFDWFGAAVLALATGVGGGIMRDTMLGNTPPIALKRPIYAIVCLFAALLIIIAQKHIVSHWKFIMFFDAIGLGTFTAIGATHAELSNAGGVAVVFLAILTAVGGGMIRDVLAGEIPVVLKADFYATAALIGGLFFFAFGLYTKEHESIRITGTILITILLRLYAMRKKIQLPKIERT